MKTLYISDLDGTLLTSEQRISERSLEIISSLTDKGMIFSYATARSIVTARKVTEGLVVRHPVIVYNGAFILNNDTGERLLKNIYTPEEAEDIYRTLSGFGISPLVYSIIDDREKFSYMPSRLTRGMGDFLDSRKGDPRHRPISEDSDMLTGEIFYFSCIDEAGSMGEAYEALKDRFHCIYGADIYSGDQWLEILPITATKANAVRQLKEYLGCERLVVLGDGINDISMFKAADECYAVANADPSLKEIADGIIGSNNEDGAAEFLSKHFSENTH
ncbi:MAG: HAD family hydrolase [Oscillospiraceae bacterium]|nr:HAD family hydrolase [Oscillospiraceae bacterium]